jgi:hypothetical protein
MNEKKDETTPGQFEKLATAGEKAAFYIRTIDDFSHWVTANIMSTSIDVEECTRILEDYIKSNEHIIQRINKIRSKSK